MGFFNPNNQFFQLLSRMVDIVGLSLLWTFLCLPIVTAGAATAALYHTVVCALRKKEEDVFRRYLRSFWGNLRVGIPAGLCCMGIGFILLLGFHVMYAHRSGGIEVVMYAMYYIALVIPLGMMCYMFPVLGRFTVNLRELFFTAFQLSFAHLPSTVVLVLVNLYGGVFIWNHIWAFGSLPVLLTWVDSLLLERIFEQYQHQ